MTTDMLHDPANSFVLKVCGDSMIDEGILDGDIVIVSRRAHANGDLVVAAVRGQVTLMRLYAEGDALFRLQPSSREHAPIFVDEATLNVQGVVVGLMRRF